MDDRWMPPRCLRRNPSCLLSLLSHLGLVFPSPLLALEPELLSSRRHQHTPLVWVTVQRELFYRLMGRGPSDRFSL